MSCGKKFSISLKRDVTYFGITARTSIFVCHNSRPSKPRKNSFNIYHCRRFIARPRSLRNFTQPFDFYQWFPNKWFIFVIELWPFEKCSRRGEWKFRLISFHFVSFASLSNEWEESGVKRLQQNIYMFCQIFQSINLHRKTQGCRSFSVPLETHTE